MKSEKELIEMNDKSHVLSYYPNAYIKWDILYTIHANSSELKTEMGGDVIGYGILKSEAWMYAKQWVLNNQTK